MSKQQYFSQCFLFTLQSTVAELYWVSNSLECLKTERQLQVRVNLRPSIETRILTD